MPGKHNAGCGCCGIPPCENCSGETPARLSLAITGVVDDSCGTCETYNTVIVLRSSQSGGCQWTLTVAGPCSTTDTWTFEIVAVSGTLTARVTLENGNTTIWEASIEDLQPIECCDDLDGLTLSYVSSDDTNCDFSSSSITLTAYCPLAQNCVPCSAYGTEFAEYVLVTVSGMADGQCTNCASVMNGSFVCPINGTPPTNGTACVGWNYEYDPTPAIGLCENMDYGPGCENIDSPGYLIGVTVSGAVTHMLQVILDGGFEGCLSASYYQYVYRKTVTGGTNGFTSCADFDVTLDEYSIVDRGVPDVCDPSGVTVRVQSL